MNRKDDEGGRKEYTRPELRRYADIRRLTEAKYTSKGRSDGAYGTVFKTG